MAYDEALAALVRNRLAAEPDLSEKRMFGGLAFLTGGSMAVAVSGQGGLMVRVDPDQTAELLATTEAAPMEMRGRTITGWLRVPAEACTAEAVARWTDMGVAYARALTSPPSK